MSRTKLTQNSIATGALNANTMLAADVVGPHAIANTSTYSVGELLVGGTILLDNTGNIQINNGGTIGSTGDADAITIATGGVDTMNQIPVLSAGLNVSGGTIAGTLATAAQPNITSLGTIAAFRSTGIDDNAAALAMTIDSSGNLGINRTNPSSIVGSTAGGFVLQDGGRSASTTQFAVLNSSGISSFSLLQNATASFSGNVGIGISPAARLHLKQAANGTNNGFRTERSDTTGHGVVYMGGDDNFYIQNQANGGINWYTNASHKMSLAANGRLGIGISPASVLHVVEVNANDATFKLQTTNSGTVGSRIELIGANQASSRYHTIGSKYGTTANWRIGGTGTDNAIDFQIGSGYTNMMRLNATGLGIGTTSPAVLLQVGPINSTETIKVVSASGGASTIMRSTSGNLSTFGSTNNVPVNFLANNAELMRILVNGNVGIGTTAAALNLHVHSASDTALLLTNTTTGSDADSGLEIKVIASGGTAYINQQENADLKIRTNDTDRVTVSAAGNVGIGMTPVANYGLLQVGSAVTSALGVTGLQAYVSGVNSALGQNGNVSIVTTTAQAANIGGSIGLGGKYHSNGTSALFAHIAGRKENGTDNNSAGYLQLATQTHGGVPTEKARISSTGDFMVGITSNNPIASRTNSMAVVSGGVRSRSGTNNTSFGLDVTSGVNINFYTDNGSAFVVGGNIATNGGTTSYNGTSDYRLKDNIQPLTDALSRVALLQPVKWTWKEELGGTESNGEGFVAHELAEILPMAVTGEKDAVDAEGKPEYQGVDPRFLVATLTAAIQEQQATIEALTARITALEG